MKVGDLIRVNTERGAILITPATVRHGQLGVIVGDPVLPEDRQWRVRLMDGELFWFDDFEMEVQ
jgi:hypothetical protein